MDIAEEQLIKIAQMIYAKIPSFQKHSLESIKEFVRIKAEELIKAS